MLTKKIYLTFFLLSISFINILVVILFNNGLSSKVFSGSKEIILFIFLIFAFLTCKHQKTIIPYFIIALIVPFSSLVFMFVSDNSDMLTKIIAYRQLVVPFLIFMLGLLLSSYNDYEKYESIYFKIGIILLVIGLIERTTYLWAGGFLTSYFESKNIAVSSIGYPYVFIEPLPFINEFHGEPGFLRMTSTFLDPINMGHTFSFLFTLAYTRRKLILSFLFFLAVVLTFSKAAIIQTLVMWILLIRFIPIYIKLFFVLFFILFALILIQNYPGFLIHLDGLVTSISKIHLFGLGLGNAGNVSFMYSGIQSGIKDSFLGAILGEEGFVGIFIYTFVIFLLVILVYKKNRYIAYFLLIQFFLSALSENSFNFLSIAFLMLYIGLLLGSKNNFIFEKGTSRCKSQSLNR